MRITRKGRAIHLDQCVYLQKVVEHCGMLNAKSASTPLPAGYYAAKGACERYVSFNMLHALKSVRAALSLSSHWLIKSI